MSTMSQFFGGGGGAGFKLAPDLTFPSDKFSGQHTYKQIYPINAVGSLTTALSLTGKWAVSWLKFGATTSETMTIKLTIDGVVIWNDTFVNTGVDMDLIGFDLNSTDPIIVVCDSTFLLEVQTTTDADIALSYVARPLL